MRAPAREVSWGFFMGCEAWRRRPSCYAFSIRRRQTKRYTLERRATRHARRRTRPSSVYHNGPRAMSFVAAIGAASIDGDRLARIENKQSRVMHRPYRRTRARTEVATATSDACSLFSYSYHTDLREICCGRAGRTSLDGRSRSLKSTTCRVLATCCSHSVDRI